MFFTWIIVSNYSGPFQVAEVFLHENVDGGRVSRISQGFQVVLPGFGSVSPIHGKRADADLEAEQRNREFSKVIELSQDTSRLRRPSFELDADGSNRYDEVIKLTFNRYQLAERSKSRRSGPRG